MTTPHSRRGTAPVTVLGFGALVLAGAASTFLTLGAVRPVSARPFPDGPDEKAIREAGAAVPSQALKLPFAEDAQIRFATANQNRKVWDELKSYWNESTEKAVDPRTGKEITRKVVIIKVPLGLTTAPLAPLENPMTVAKFHLGKKLYFDALVSSDGTVSCASCHKPSHGYTDRAKVSTGIFDSKGGVSAPTVFNSAYNAFQFWDGRASSLEIQCQGPPQNPKEMWDGKGHAWHSVITRMRAKPEYVKAFEKAFGHGPTIDAAAKAIATYERTVLTGNAIADRAEVAMRERLEEEDAKGKPALEGRDVEKVLKKAIADKETEVIKAFGLGDNAEAALPALGASIARGKAIFIGKARCASCHAGDNFTDSDFHNLGVGAKDGKLPEGDQFRFGAQEIGHKNPDLYGATKTPTLRQLLNTAPYMHDGSEATLEEVVDFYDKGGNVNATLDFKMRDFDAEKAWLKAQLDGTPVTGPQPFLTSDGMPIIPFKLGLTPQEKKDLVNYLKALNGVAPDAIVTQP